MSKELSKIISEAIIAGRSKPATYWYTQGEGTLWGDQNGNFQHEKMVDIVKAHHAKHGVDAPIDDHPQLGEGSSTDAPIDLEEPIKIKVPANVDPAKHIHQHLQGIIKGSKDGAIMPTVDHIRNSLNLAKSDSAGITTVARYTSEGATYHSHEIHKSDPWEEFRL